MDQKQFTGYIIDRELWAFMTALDPHFKELSYEENEGRYLVINYEGKTPEDATRWMIVHAETFPTLFDHMTNAEPIKTYNFVE